MTIVLIIIGVIVLIIILRALFSPQKLMLKKMENEAKKIVDDVLKLTTSNCNDESKLYSATCKLLNLSENNDNKELVEGIKKYCICIEGICYFIALHFRLPLSMKLRCAQFVNLIDYYLYQNGVNPCSIENKILILKYVDLYDIYEHDPSIFSVYNNKRGY